LSGFVYKEGLMKRIAYVMSVVLTLSCVARISMAEPPLPKIEQITQAYNSQLEQITDAKNKFNPFAVYTEAGAKDNHFIPSGWMGDYGDLKINPGWTKNPHSGKTCFQIIYSAKMTQGAGWAGIYWQHPSNNWGTKKAHITLTGATKLTFWARGEKGGEKFAEFKMGGISGEYPDSDSAVINSVELTTEWKKFEIDLKGKDLSEIRGGFCWSASKDDNPDGFTFYLDDIMYE
jgi:hypothetical protein